MERSTTDVRHLLKSMNQDAVWLVTLVLQYLEGMDSEEDLLIGVNNAVEKIQQETVTIGAIDASSIDFNVDYITA